MTETYLVLKLQWPTTDHYEGSDRPDRPKLVKGTPEYLAAKAQLDADLDIYQSQRPTFEDPQHSLYPSLMVEENAKNSALYLNDENRKKYTMMSAAEFQKKYPSISAKVDADLEIIREKLSWGLTSLPRDYDAEDSDEDEIAVGPNVKAIADGPPPLITEEECRQRRMKDLFTQNKS